MKRTEERELYHQYETELFSIDNKTKIHTPPYWWENSTDGIFLAIYDNLNAIGFASVGYGKFVDPDVESEICEIYLSRRHRTLFFLRKL